MKFNWDGVKQKNRLIYEILSIGLTVVNIVYLFISTTVFFRIVAVILVFAVVLIISIIFTLTEDKKKANIEHGFVGDKSILVTQNYDFLRDMYKSKEYNDVCNIGPVFARVFYLAGALVTRLKTERLIFESAEMLGKDQVCANALVNLGWSTVLLNKKEYSYYSYKNMIFTSPEEYFFQAIRYAESQHNYALISKAYSHISGYMLTLGDFLQATEYRTKAGEYMELLKESKEKEIIKSSLVYNDAETSFLKKDYPSAMKYCVMANELRRAIGEEDREVRYFAQIGKIEYALNNYSSAKSHFLSGIDRATKTKRIDEIAKNTYGYALCLIKEGQRKEAIKKIKNLIQEYGEIPLFVSDEFFRKEYNIQVFHTT